MDAKRVHSSTLLAQARNQHQVGPFAPLSTGRLGCRKSDFSFRGWFRNHKKIYLQILWISELL